jgi:hypothetical protein
MEDEARASEARFVEYVESLAEVLGYVEGMRRACHEPHLARRRQSPGPWTRNQDYRPRAHQLECRTTLTHCNVEVSAEAGNHPGFQRKACPIEAR